MTSKINVHVKPYQVGYIPNKYFNKKHPNHNMFNKILCQNNGIQTIATVKRVNGSSEVATIALVDYKDPDWFKTSDNMIFLVDTQNILFEDTHNKIVYDNNLDVTLYKNKDLYQTFKFFKNKSYLYNLLQVFYERVNTKINEDFFYGSYTQPYCIITDNNELFEELCLYNILIHSYQMLNTNTYSKKNKNMINSYNHIIIDNNIKTILDILAELPEDKIKQYTYKLKTATNDFEYYTDSAFDKSVKIFNQILNEYFDSHDLKTYRLIEPSEQIKAYLDFTKLYLDQQYQELITDEQMESIKRSDVYKQVLSKLKTNGLQISKTQQFNVLQSIGILNSDESYVDYTKKDDKSKFIYNLSDMGSGKTLMTVEALYLADLQKAKEHYERFELNKDIDISDRIPDSTSTDYWFSAKTLVAPTLSIESSWIETFTMFYDSVEKVSKNRYKLSVKYKDLIINSYLDINGFTVKNNTIKSEKYNDSNPKSMIETSNTLIIDEIHQLLKELNVRNSKKLFDQKPMTYKHKFILSGTLSDLTPTDWYKYCKLMDLDIDYLCDPKLDKAKDPETIFSYSRYDITDSVKNIKDTQNRTLSGETIEYSSDRPTTNVTREYKALQAYYGDKLAYLNPNYYKDKGPVDIETVLLNSQYMLDTDPDISNTPNIRLFYNIVGRNAITATTHQISKELTNKTYSHETVVIKSKASLDKESIKILKTIHNIASDYNIYKSKSLATKLNNTILNLNDGLSDNNLYDILNSKANNNNKFLEYLTNLDLSILEDLKSSQLIKMPSLEDSEKLKIVKDIIDKEPDEKFLIIVNDLNAAKALSTALGITSLTSTDLKDPIKYQAVLDDKFKKQNVVVVPQFMIKSSLNLQYVTRLIQYQLNEDIADIIQTQNRIDRIGKTHETKAYYIATDILQENIIELFLETYKNVKIAHKGIIELFEDMTKDVNVVNDYIDYALKNLESR